MSGTSPCPSAPPVHAACVVWEMLGTLPGFSVCGGSLGGASLSLMHEGPQGRGQALVRAKGLYSS